MTDHDVQLLLDGAMLGEMFLLGCWWAWRARDRRKDRLAAEKGMAEAQAALDRVQAAADKLDRTAATLDGRP